MEEDGRGVDWNRVRRRITDRYYEGGQNERKRKRERKERDERRNCKGR